MKEHQRVTSHQSLATMFGRLMDYESWIATGDPEDDEEEEEEEKKKREEAEEEEENDGEEEEVPLHVADPRIGWGQTPLAVYP